MFGAKWRTARRGLAVGGAAVVGLWALPRFQYWRKEKQLHTPIVMASEDQKKQLTPYLISRLEQLQNLEQKEFDVLVIGGGATGTGVALDAVSRGLETALIEKQDFSSGTSSRSTKLIHGGVRYLQKAILGFDIEQYRMVKEALAERANLLQIAPHLAYPLPIMLPVYKWWQLPYFWVGIKSYDLVAGRQLIKSSYVISKSKALELFPMLKKDRLVGAIVYYDGQHDDARMCISIATTAARLGATVANHTEVLDLIKEQDADGNSVVRGATVKDVITGKTFKVKAKCVINATGPFTDSIRRMDDHNNQKICQPSSGVHVILPDYYSPANMGLLDPSTSDGRVIFFLPWQNSTMAGTTDNPCEVSDKPAPTEAEVQFILKEVKNYLNEDVNVRRGDVLSAWSGIRPLVLNPSAKNTQSIARNHIIDVSESNLITVGGGKWTTYRHMAEETLDRAIEACGLKSKSECCTRGLLLDGAHGWSPTLFIRLIQDFGLDHDIAKHLADTYGDHAVKIAKKARLTGKRWPVVGKRLHEDYPYIEAEIPFAIKEYAYTATDIIARRTRLGFLNVHAAEEALPRVIEIMTAELGWDKKRQKQEHDEAIEFLHKEMGLSLRPSIDHVPINLTKQEINMYADRFKKMDSGSKGYITVNDLRTYFKKIGEPISEDQLHEILTEVDTSKNAMVDLGEFLQLMSGLKVGVVTGSRLARAAELNEDMSKPISVARSGGGV